MKKLSLVALAVSVSFMVGCVKNSVNSNNASYSKTQFELAFGVKYLPEYGQYDNRVRFALKPLKGYGQDDKNSNMRWSDSYYFNEKNTPQTINIQYAILLDKPTPVNKNIWEETNKKLQSLPPSAWRTYTVNLKPVQDELNRRYHADPDPKWTYRFGIKATITLYIDSNGNITQKVEYSSVTGRVFT